MKLCLKFIFIFVLINSLPAIAKVNDVDGNAMPTQLPKVAARGVINKSTVIYPATSVKNNASSLSVLIDLSKPRLPASGSYFGLIELLNADGYSVSTSNESVLNLNLEDYDVIVLGARFAGEAYSQAETDTIKAYVNNGGGLFIVGEASDCYLCAAANQVLSDISKPIAGMSFSPDVTIERRDLSFSNLASHEIFTNVNQLFYRYAGSVQVDSSEYSLAKTDDGQHTLIALNNNVIVVSDTSFTGIPYLDRADNAQFIQNTFSYLATGSVEGSEIDADLSIEKRINFFDASSQSETVNLAIGNRYRAQYKVTNNFNHRIYEVNVFSQERGGEELVCSLSALDPGQSKTCEGSSRQIFLRLNNVPGTARARSSADNSIYVNQSDAWYEGHSDVTGQLNFKHYVNNRLANRPNQAAQVNADDEISWLFSVKNDSNIDVYRTRFYADPVAPANTGWQEQCFVGKLRAGETRHCKVTTIAGEGMHHVIGRVRSSISPSAGVREKLGADNSTYYFGQSK